MRFTRRKYNSSRLSSQEKRKNKSRRIQKNMKGGGLNELREKYKILTIPEGTILYRSSPDICNQYGTPELISKNIMECGDTGKKGVYFGNSNGAILALAISLEYDKLLEIGVFKTTRDLEVSNGKYSFQYLKPERYYNENETPKFGEYVETLPEENVAHFDPNILPLKKSKKLLNYGSNVAPLLPEKLEEKLYESGSGEVFLTEKELPSIEFVKRYKYNPEKIKMPRDLLKYMKRNNYPFDLDKYIEDEIIIEVECV